MSVKLHHMGLRPSLDAGLNPHRQQQQVILNVHVLQTVTVTSTCFVLITEELSVAFVDTLFEFIETVNREVPKSFYVAHPSDTAAVACREFEKSFVMDKPQTRMDDVPTGRFGSAKLPCLARQDTSFQARSLMTSDALRFWETELLPLSGLSRGMIGTITKWLKHGVSVKEFTRRFKGWFDGRYFDCDMPPSCKLCNVPIKDPADWAFIHNGVKEDLASGAIRKVLEPPKCILPIGVDRNGAGKQRRVMDCRMVNNWAPSPRVHWETLNQFKLGIDAGALMFSLEHKNGYHHVGIDEESQAYFGFVWEGEYYVSTVLPFGFAPAAYIYNTLSSVVAAYLRRKAIHCLVYIDHFGFSARKGQTFEQVAALVAYVLMVMHSAGYFVSREKSNLLPSTTMTLLGFTLDSVNRRFSIPQQKLDRVLNTLESIVSKREVELCALQAFVGMTQALALAAPPVTIFLRSAVELLAQRRREGRRFHLKFLVGLPSNVVEDLSHVKHVGSWERLAVWKTQRRVCLQAQAGNFGWSATFFADAKPVVATGTFIFTDGEGPEVEHTTAREAAAITNAMKAFRHLIPCQGYLDVLVCSTSAQCNSVKATGIVDPLVIKLAMEILSWELERNVTIQLFRTDANHRSDSKLHETQRVLLSLESPYVAWKKEWRHWNFSENVERGGFGYRLNPRWFRALQSRTPKKFTMDICASASDRQVKRFIASAACGHPDCVAVNVFAYGFPFCGPRGDLKEYVYCDPPWAMIGPIWAHLRENGVAGVIVFPEMPQRAWYAMVLRQAVRVGILAPVGTPDVFVNTGRGHHHSLGPLWWNLMFACFDFSNARE